MERKRPRESKNGGGKGPYIEKYTSFEANATNVQNAALRLLLYLQPVLLLQPVLYLQLLLYLQPNGYSRTHN